MQYSPSASAVDRAFLSETLSLAWGEASAASGLLTVLCTAIAPNHPSPRSRAAGLPAFSCNTPAFSSEALHCIAIHQTGAVYLHRRTNQGPQHTQSSASKMMRARDGRLTLSDADTAWHSILNPDSREGRAANPIQSRAACLAAVGPSKIASCQEPCSLLRPLQKNRRRSTSWKNACDSSSCH